MNWIYELSLPSLKGSQKELKTKAALEEIVTKQGSAALFQEIVPKIKISLEALIGLTEILERHLLEGIIEKNKVDEAFLMGLIQLGIGLHKMAIKSDKVKKVSYVHKLFNKIVKKLSETDRNIFMKGIEEHNLRFEEHFR